MGYLPFSSFPLQLEYGIISGTAGDTPFTPQFSNNQTRIMPTANSAFMKPMTLSDDLAAVVGKGPMPRSEVVKGLWAYIKKHNLQDPANKRNINADDKLKAVFGGKATVNMFEMTKLVSKHLS